jgi:hypothetical protein
MSDSEPAHPNEQDDINARIARHTEQFAQAFAQNKEALFDALAAAGISHVVVSFDGAGDEGQIENIETKAGDAIVKLPTSQVPVAYIHWHDPNVVQTPDKLEDAVEKLVYDCFEKHCSGWDQGEGSYGDVTFDVAARTIMLDFNARFIDSENSQYTL